jgi:hypothetical protein
LTVFDLDRMTALRTANPWFNVHRQSHKFTGSGLVHVVGSCITTMCDCKTGSRLPQSGRGYSSDTKQKNPTSASTPTEITSGVEWPVISRISSSLCSPTCRRP